MTFEEKQKELDISKWNKSQSLRLDACGSFNYCSCCNMKEKYPCANAYGKFYNEQFEGVVDTKAEVKEETKPAKKTCAKKASTTKKETKKESPKKTTTKKSTTTKKTTKK